MATNYATVEGCYRILPMLKDVTDLSSGDLGRFIEDAENEVNGRLAKSYAVPVGAPLLETIATDIAIYRALSRRIFTQESLQDSVWPDRYKEAIDLLQEVADGSVTLVDSAGVVIVDITTHAEVWSDKQGYHPTFWEGHEYDQIQDQDKIDDGASERDLTNVADRLT